MKIYRNSGFTLIELLIVVAIVGIIGAVAYPSYLDSVRKTNRADAKASLTNAAQQMQRCYTLNNTFTDCEMVGTTDSSEEYYTIEVDVTGGGSGFTATATPAKSPQTDDDECTEFTLDHLGRKEASGSYSESCW